MDFPYCPSMGCVGEWASQDRNKSCAKIKCWVWRFYPKITRSFLFWGMLWTSCGVLQVPWQMLESDGSEPREYGMWDAEAREHTLKGQSSRESHGMNARKWILRTMHLTEFRLLFIGLVVVYKTSLSISIQPNRKTKRKYKEKQEPRLTSFHINPLNLAVLSEKPLKITLTSIILKVSAKDRLHDSYKIDNRNDL